MNEDDRTAEIQQRLWWVKCHERLIESHQRSIDSSRERIAEERALIEEIQRGGEP